MPNVNVAERILALVTTGDRAASIVGDLMEGAATRGVFWFWFGASRTAASLLWRNVAEETGRLTRLAFLGLAVYIGVELVFTGLSGLAFFGAIMGSGHPLHLDSIGWKLWFAAPVVVSSLFIGVVMYSNGSGRGSVGACPQASLQHSLDTMRRVDEVRDQMRLTTRSLRGQRADLSDFPPCSAS
jgi:hypothetical protein